MQVTAKAKPKRFRPRALKNRFQKTAESIAKSVSSSIYRNFRRINGTSSVSKDDLYQEAYIGILKARLKYDPSKGKNFHAFAYPYARGAVLTFLREHVPFVALPRYVLEHVSNADAFKARISGLYDIAFTAKTIGERNSAIKKISQLTSARAGIQPISGNKGVKEGKGTQLFEIMESKGGFDSMEQAEARDLQKTLPLLFKEILGPKTAEIFKLRYNSPKGLLPLNAVAEILGLPASTAVNLHNQGLERLRESERFREAVGMANPKKRKKAK